jgi:hypothetical protein
MSTFWSLTGGKRTWRLRAPTSEFDPGCVKTRKFERRREYFSEIDCNRTSPRSFDDQKRQLVECLFYAVAAPPRFHTAKTRSGHSTVWTFCGIIYARIEDAETETENAATQVHPADRGNGCLLAAGRPCAPIDSAVRVHARLIKWQTSPEVVS